MHKTLAVGTPIMVLRWLLRELPVKPGNSCRRSQMQPASPMLDSPGCNASIFSGGYVALLGSNRGVVQFWSICCKAAASGLRPVVWVWVGSSQVEPEPL